MYDVWKNALAEIEQQISTANFSTWFQDTSLLSTEDGNIKIGVKNSFYVKQLRNRYLDLIKTALENNNITVVISDNETTAMTGGQDSAGTGKLEAICAGLGVKPEHIRVLVPLKKNFEEMKQVIREEIEYNGVSVIIPRRECLQTLKRKKVKN